MNDDAALECPSCGYDQRGLPAEHRCPECGLAFDRETVIWSASRRSRMLRVDTVVAITLLLGLWTLRSVIPDVAWPLLNQPTGYRRCFTVIDPAWWSGAVLAFAVSWTVLAFLAPRSIPFAIATRDGLSVRVKDDNIYSIPWTGVRQLEAKEIGSRAFVKTHVHDAPRPLDLSPILGNRAAEFLAEVRKRCSSNRRG